MEGKLYKSTGLRIDIPEGTFLLQRKSGTENRYTWFIKGKTQKPSTTFAIRSNLPTHCVKPKKSSQWCRALPQWDVDWKPKWEMRKMAKGDKRIGKDILVPSRVRIPGNVGKQVDTRKHKIECPAKKWIIAKCLRTASPKSGHSIVHSLAHKRFNSFGGARKWKWIHHSLASRKTFIEQVESRRIHS